MCTHELTAHAHKPTVPTLFSLQGGHVVFEFLVLLFKLWPALVFRGARAAELSLPLVVCVHATRLILAVPMCFRCVRVLHFRFFL